jgi:predicted PurR-regulated permease PerM
METKHARLLCWTATILILAVFIHLQMLKFLVFILFMYLVTDLLMHGIGDRIRFISKRTVLYATYVLVLALVVLIVAVVVPRFISELPVYLEKQLIEIKSRLTEMGISTGSTLDYPVLKEKAIAWFHGHLSGTFDFIKKTGSTLFLFVFALVITFLLAHRNAMKTKPNDKTEQSTETLLDYYSSFIVQKVSSFYAFFKQVMAAQVIISIINTILTLAMLIILDIPHKIILTVFCFLFGLIPVVGNLISNTLICLAAFLWSGTWQAAVVLGFLVAIHKLEYFLNGKIIGHMVKIPMFITLLGLLVGEALFRIPGMILAVPVLLFIREEMKSIRIHESMESGR